MAAITSWGPPPSGYFSVRNRYSSASGAVPSGRMPMSGIVPVKARPPAVVVPSAVKSFQIGSTRYEPTWVKSGIVAGGRQMQKQNRSQLSKQIQWQSWWQKRVSLSSLTSAENAASSWARTASVRRVKPPSILAIPATAWAKARISSMGDSIARGSSPPVRRPPSSDRVAHRGDARLCPGGRRDRQDGGRLHASHRGGPGPGRSRVLGARQGTQAHPLLPPALPLDLLRELRAVLLLHLPTAGDDSALHPRRLVSGRSDLERLHRRWHDDRWRARLHRDDPADRHPARRNGTRCRGVSLPD